MWWFYAKKCDYFYFMIQDILLVWYGHLNGLAKSFLAILFCLVTWFMIHVQEEMSSYSYWQRWRWMCNKTKLVLFLTFWYFCCLNLSELSIFLLSSWSHCNKITRGNKTQNKYKTRINARIWRVQVMEVLPDLGTLVKI